MSGARKLAIGVSLMVAVAVVYGLILAGSPQRARGLKFDDQRLDHLRNLANSVERYAADEGKLPPSLEILEAKGHLTAKSVNDPETGAAYEYRPFGDEAIELCAVFSYPTSEDEDDGRYRYDVAPIPVKGQGATVDQRAFGNPHPAGKHCYRLPVLWPGQKVAPKAPGTPADGCMLMTYSQTGEVDCFGCANGVCNDPPVGWVEYQLPEGSIGIPYACHESPQGCVLAQ